MSLNNSISISNQAGTMTVDFADKHVDFSLSLGNPSLVDFATPTADIAIDAAPEFNTYAFNIGFLTNGFTLSFKESGGLGSILNATRTTVFEKLFYLTYFDKSWKKFYLNDTGHIPVTITNYKVHVGPGAHDFIDHVLTLMITNEEGT